MGTFSCILLDCHLHECGSTDGSWGLIQILGRPSSIYMYITTGHTWQKNVEMTFFLIILLRQVIFHRLSVFGNQVMLCSTVVYMGI